ncbi:MAG: adenosylmethionine decarboxylase [Chloroflexi bacterium]|nr:adenosylmethionine decarboxylase [Chloroflexota bacterium]MCZ6789257.1 adenosylmethionine decarboxylase [Chloroflexota bacterium]
MNALGTQLLLELNHCDRDLLNDLSYVRSTLTRAAHAVGATIIGESFHKFSPHGVTGVLAIAESHICIHTWPEYGYAAVDVFTCGEGFDPEKAAGLLIEGFRSQSPSQTIVKRGALPDSIEVPQASS